MMARQSDDRARARRQDPNFQSLIIGIHWPSLPWGNESIGGILAGPAEDELADERDMPTDELIERIADTPKRAMRSPPSLPPQKTPRRRRASARDNSHQPSTTPTAPYSPRPGSALTASRRRRDLTKTNSPQSPSPTNGAHRSMGHLQQPAPVSSASAINSAI